MQLSNIMACLDHMERLGIDVDTLTANGKSLVLCRMSILGIVELFTWLIVLMRLSNFTRDVDGNRLTQIEVAYLYT